MRRVRPCVTYYTGTLKRDQSLMLKKQGRIRILDIHRPNRYVCQ